MNALIAFLNAIPAFTKLFTLLAEKFIEWERAQQKDSFRKAIEEAIKTGDTRQLDGGKPSGHAGVSVSKPEP